MSIFAELKRRNVLRVLIAYLAGAWLLVQIADVLWPIYGLSETSLQLLTNIVGIGLIPAVIISWVFEWTPQGLKRDADVVPGESIAPQTGKTMDRTIIVVLAVAVGFFAFDKFVLDEDPLSLEERSSIAVLPFVNMSADPDQVYFSDGISEEILNLLARIRQLRVISRSSAFTYRGETNLREVAEALNVAYILEGSVRKSGDKIRITAQLIDAEADAHIWSETWDRDFEDIFAIQDEVAVIVARRLELQILGQALESRRTDPELYAIYLQAMHQSSSLQEQIEQLEYVVEQDPNYLPAINELGLAYYFATGLSAEDLYRPEIGYALRDAQVKKAIELDPDDAEANAYLAWEYVEARGDLMSAAQAAEKSFRNGSGDADVLRLLAALGREMQKFDTAIVLGQLSIARDPLCDECFWVLGYIYMRAGRFEDAERMFRIFTSKNPGSGRISLGNALLAQGRAQEALDTMERQGGDDIAIIANIANALYSLNRFDEFDESLERVIDQGGEGSAMDLAGAYAWSGDADKAFYWLNKTAESGVRQIRMAQRNFLFTSLHEDPRWDAFWDEHWYTEEEFAAVELNIP